MNNRRLKEVKTRRIDNDWLLKELTFSCSGKNPLRSFFQKLVLGKKSLDGTYTYRRNVDDLASRL